MVRVMSLAPFQVMALALFRSPPNCSIPRRTCELISAYCVTRTPLRMSWRLVASTPVRTRLPSTAATISSIKVKPRRAASARLRAVEIGIKSPLGVIAGITARQAPAVVAVPGDGKRDLHHLPGMHGSQRTRQGEAAADRRVAREAGVDHRRVTGVAGLRPGEEALLFHFTLQHVGGNLQVARRVELQERALQRRERRGEREGENEHRHRHLHDGESAGEPWNQEMPEGAAGNIIYSCIVILSAAKDPCVRTWHHARGRGLFAPLRLTGIMHD